MALTEPYRSGSKASISCTPVGVPATARARAKGFPLLHILRALALLPAPHPTQAPPARKMFQGHYRHTCAVLLVNIMLYPFISLAGQASPPSPAPDTDTPALHAASHDNIPSPGAGTYDAPAEAPEPPAAPEKVFANPTDKEVFGYYGQKLHPFASLQGRWTDNLYNLDFDKKSSFKTSAAAGLWLSLPSAEKTPARLASYNVTIGGSRYSLPDRDSFSRFQAFFLGGVEHKTYSLDSSLDYTAWNLEGAFQYNLPAGLSVRIMDRFTRDRDRFDIGSFLPRDFTVDADTVQVQSTPSRIREYMNNQAYLALHFNTSHRFSLLLDYTNFYLHYDEPVNNWLNRTDNRYSVVLAYRYSPRTSFFGEYARAAVRYRETGGNNSDNVFLYGGVSWKGSAKSTLMAKGGYQEKKYEDPADTGDGTDTLTMEVQFNHALTEKTRISFRLYKALEESNSLVFRGMDTTAARFRYDQEISYNIRGFCDFQYEYSDYGDSGRPDGYIDETANRNDTAFTIKPGLQYYLRQWLMAELSYSYETRDSTENLYDYTTHTVFLSLNITF